MSIFNIVEIDNINGVVSTLNSSASVLSGNAVFTGTGEDVSGFASVSITVKTDQDSAVNGFSVQFSTDNSNWDITHNYSISANVVKNVQFTVPTNYFRVVFTNGATLQTSFRLQSIFHPTRNALDTGSLATTSAKTLDYDTTSATDTVPIFGIGLPSTTGAVAGGTSTNPIRIDPTGTTTQPISGTVTVLGDTDELNQLNLTNSKPLSVAIVDTDGNQVGSFGGGTQYTEDDPSVANPVGTQLISRRRDTLASEVTTDGDFIAVNSTAKGELYVKHVDSIPVTGTITADTELPAASSLADATSNPSTPLIGAALELFNGTTWDRVRGDISNGLDVDVTRVQGNVNVTNSGTFATQAAQSGTWTVQPGNTANTTAWKVDASSVAVPITDNSGSLTVDNAGTFAVQDSQTISDNGAFTDGTSKLFASGHILDEVAGTALTENDIAASRIDSKRAQVFVIEDESTRGRRTTVTAANALKVDNSGVTQPVSGTITANAGTGTFTVSGSVTADTELPAAATLTDATTNPSTTAVNALLSGFNGTTWDRLRSDTSNGLDVDVTRVSGNVTVINGGTFAVQAAQSGTWTVQPGNTANTTAWKVDGSAVTQPVSGTVSISGTTTISGAVTNAGTFAVQDSQVIVDNAAFTDGTSKVFAAGYIYDEVAGTALTENDIGAARINVNRAVVSAIEDGATRGRYATVSASNALKVDGSAVTQPISGTITANAGTGTFTVSGVDVHDAPVTANPELIGARASTAIPTSVSADGDAVRLWADRQGALKVSLVDTTGDSAMDNTNDALRVNVVAGGSGDGAILDGVSSSIKATVLDLTNSNPLTVAITDGAGTQITSFGGGTQYTEDDASAANPTGTQLISRRRDALVSEVTTDGDVIAVNSTSKGELYVKHVDAIPVTDNSGSLTVDNAGTFAVQAAQSGTWTVQPGNTANTTAWKVDGSAVTQPISGTVTANAGSGTFTISGAVTNAGTFAVQDSQVLTDNGAFTDGTSKLFAAGYIYDEVAGTALTENDIAAARINVNRAAVHALEDGSTRGRYATVTAANALKVDASGAAVPVTDNSGSLTVDNAGTFAVQAAQSGTWTVQPGNTANTTAWKVDGSAVTQPVSGTVTANAGSGTFNISGPVTNAGTFAVQATIAASATNIAKAEDVASADADVGVPAMAIRKASPANTSGTDGDYEMLQMAAGRLWTSATIDSALPAGSNTIGAINIAAAQTLATVTTVSTVTNLSQLNGNAISMNTGVRDAGTQRVTIATNDVVPVSDNSGSLTVDNAGTFAIQDSEKLADNAAFTDGSTKVMPVGFIYDEVAGTALTENDIAAARITVNRAIVSAIEDGVTRGRYATVSASNALKVDNSGVTQPISGTVSISGTVTVDSELPAAASLADATANPSTTSVGAFLSGYNGTTWDRLRSTTANGLAVDVTRVQGNVNVTNSGTFAVQAAQSGTWTVQPGNTANTTAWKVDGSSVTQPVSGTVTANAGSGTFTIAGAVTNAGTFSVQDSQVLTDNGAFTDGTSKLFASGFIYDEVAGTALTENDIAAARITVNRAIVSAIEDGVTRGRYTTVTASNALKVDNSGVTQPVSGTITANAGTGFPSVQTEDAASAGGETGVMILGVRNDAASSKTNTDGDFSAIATDAAGRVGIADLGGSITVDNAGTFAVQAAQSGTWTVQPGNTANTTAWKVDGSAVTQPVSGTVTANAGSGTFTIAGAVTNAGTFAIQDSEKLADNAAFTDGSTKVMPVGYIYDEVAGTALTENDVAAPRINVNRATVGILEDGTTRGRYATVTASNALKIDGSGVTQPVNNAGTFAVQDSQVLTDNAAFTDTISKVFPVGYIYDEVAGTALSENDVAAPRITVNRAVVSAIEDGSTRGRYATVSASNALKVDGSAVTQPISGTVTANAGTGTFSISGSVTADTELPNAATLGDATANPATTSVGAFLSGYNGTTWDRLRATTANGLAVDVTRVQGNVTVINSGTFAVQAAQSGTWTVQPGNTANTTAWKVDASSAAVPVTDNSGSLTVDNGGTFAIQDSEKLVDNAAFTDGSTKVMPVGFIYDEVAGTALTENDIAAARITVNRALVSALEDGSTRGRYATVTASNALKVDASGAAIPVTDNSGSLTVDNAGTFAVQAAQSGTWTVQPGNTANTTAWKVDGSSVTQPVSGTVSVSGTVTVDSELPAAASLADATANPSTTSVGAFLSGYNGTTWDRLRSTIANGLAVDVTRVSGTVTIAGAVTNAGTFAVQDSQVLTDNGAFTDGSSKVFAAGYIYDEVAGTALTEDDIATPRINVNRATVHTLEDGSTRGRYATVTAANALKVDGSAVTQPVSLNVPTTVSNAKVTVSTAGTRVQFATTTCVSIIIKALSTNTGFIFVGNATVAASNGYVLSAGDVLSLDISNTNALYIDSSVNGEGVTWLSTN